MKGLLACVFLLVGCSDAAPGADASVDATLADAGPQAGPVRVTVTRAGVPEPNVRVFFHDEQGALEDARTDTTGQASSRAAVTMVTLVLDFGGRPRELFTYMDVRDGDQLALELPGPSVQVPLFELQLSAPVPEATHYEVSGGSPGCVLARDPSEALPGTLTVTSLKPCLTTPSALLITARSDERWSQSSLRPVGYAVVDTPAPTAGRSLPVSVGAFGFGGDATLSVTGAKEEQSFQHGLVYAKANTLGSLSPSDGSDLVRDERAFLLPPVRGDALIAEATLRARLNTHTFQQRSSTATSFTIAVGPEARLPAISEFGVQRDFSTRPLTWRADESPEQDASLVVVRLNFEDAAGELGNVYSWTFVLPPAQRSVTPPSLPQMGANTRWQADRVVHVRTSAVRGYDAYRNRTLRYSSFMDGRKLVDETPLADGTSEVLTYADPYVIE